MLESIQLVLIVAVVGVAISLGVATLIYLLRETLDRIEHKHHH